MAEPGVGYGKHLGVFLFLRLESGILFVRCKPSLSAASYVRLGHATSIVTRANPSKADYTGAGYVLEPRPTKKNVEDKDDGKFENDEPPPLLLRIMQKPNPSKRIHVNK
jgi:hypothetical protein